MNKIHFTVELNGKQFQVATSKNEHLSLMSLLSDRFALTNFGLCCGMRSCGTCSVKIDGELLLSCEVPVNEALESAYVIVL
jgi:aerobic-type carbon monoxide dehydrogenase small subunit (CoxS/CutS family)